MRVLHIRTQSVEHAECLVRELAVYAPRRQSRAVSIELDGQPHAAVLALLAAIDTCLGENGIRSVRITLDGKRYTMEPSALAR